MGNDGECALRRHALDEPLVECGAIGQSHILEEIRNLPALDIAVRHIDIQSLVEVGFQGILLRDGPENHQSPQTHSADVADGLPEGARLVVDVQAAEDLVVALSGAQVFHDLVQNGKNPVIRGTQQIKDADGVRAALPQQLDGQLIRNVTQTGSSRPHPGNRRRRQMAALRMIRQRHRYRRHRQPQFTCQVSDGHTIKRE